MRPRVPLYRVKKKKKKSFAHLLMRSIHPLGQAHSKNWSIPSNGKHGALPPTFVTTNSITLLARRVHLYLTEEDNERISGMLTCKGEDGDESGEWGSKWGEMDLRILRAIVRE